MTGQDLTMWIVRGEGALDVRMPRLREYAWLKECLSCHGVHNLKFSLFGGIYPCFMRWRFLKLVPVLDRMTSRGN